MQRLFYFLGRAVGNLRLHPFATGVNLLTLTAALFMLGSLFVLENSLARAVPSWMSDVKAVAYLRADVSGQRGRQLAEETARWKGVEKVRWVSRQEAWRRLRGALQEWSDVFEGFKENPLPASLEITLAGSAASTGDGPAVIERFRRLPEVESIYSGRQWFKKLDAFIQLMGFLGKGVLLVVSLITIVIVSNTVKLTVFARRRELEIYTIVGASAGFAKIPFYLEAILQGVLAASFAVWPLGFLLHLITWSLPEPLAHVVSWQGVPELKLFVYLAACGIGFGLAGSWLALRRFFSYG